MRFGMEGLRRAGEFQGLWGGAGFIVAVIVGILLIALIVFCTVVCIKYLKAAHKQTNNKQIAQNALNILNDRYARGEITEEEYKQKKKDITSPF